MILAMDPGSQNLAWGMYDPVKDTLVALELEDLRDPADVDKMKANKAKKGKMLIARKREALADGDEGKDDVGVTAKGGRRTARKAPRAKISESQRLAVLMRMKAAFSSACSGRAPCRLTSVVESQQRTGRFQGKVRQVEAWFSSALGEMGGVEKEPAYTKFEALGLPFPKGPSEENRKQRKAVSRDYVDAWMASPDGLRRTTAAVRGTYAGRCKRDDMADVVMMLLARGPLPVPPPMHIQV